MNEFPIEQWSDLNSPRFFVEACNDYNQRVRAYFSSPMSSTVAGDMFDCYHHIPSELIPQIWRQVQCLLEGRGISCVSVPHKVGQGKGKLGTHDLSGWVAVPLDAVASVLDHFVPTDYVQVGDNLGKEIRGVPMGDALGNAALRLFKWSCERRMAQVEWQDTVRVTGCHTQVVCTPGGIMLVLDVSCRDDIRFFCSWDSNAEFAPGFVQHWCWSHTPNVMVGVYMYI